MLGLNRNVVMLAPYTNAWTGLFQEEKTLLEKILGQHVLAIEHIGSTAVKGIAAKPLIDIIIGVQSLDDVQLFDELKLREAGIYRLGRVNIEGKVVFAKFTNMEVLTKTHVYHVVEYQGSWWDKHIRFRDYLNAHPETAKEYETLKIQLAERFPTNEKEYAEAKVAFIDRVLEKVMHA